MRVDTTLLAFAGVSALLAVTPGPDMAVVTRNALAHGRRGVILTTAGIGAALTIHVLASAVGLSALLRASAAMFMALRLVGGAYLAYLGARALWASRHRPPPLAVPRPAAAGSILRQGFLSALLNPKLAVFFVTFLPQWVQPGRPVLPRLLLLGAIFAAVGIAWLSLYGTLVTRLQDAITRPRVRQWMERGTGVVLLGFGARLALERA